MVANARTDGKIHAQTTSQNPIKATEEIAAVLLADETHPIGIRYGSKHGSDWTCWSIWLRDTTRAAIDVDQGAPVAPPARNPALAKVLAAYNLTT